MPRAWLLKRVQLIVDAEAAVDFNFYTDLPGDAMVIRSTKTFTTTATTPRRRVVNLDLPPNVKGRLFQYSLVTAGTVRLYGGFVYARPMDGGDWTWLEIPGLGKQLTTWTDIALPIAAQPKGWSELPLPIPKQPDSWAAIALPIPKTPEGWSDLILPMPKQPDGWGEKDLGLHTAPDAPNWVELPVDA